MRGAVWGAAGLILLVAIGAAVFALRGHDRAGNSPIAAATEELPGGASAQNTIGLDLMRIEPVGSFVAAGHATPGAAIAIRDGEGTVWADGLADGRGEWLLASHDDLTAGNHELFVFMGQGDETPRRTDIVALINLPSVRGPRPLAIQIVTGHAPRVLQSPDGPAASAGLIEAAEFSNNGILTLGGRADPGTSVYIYLDDAFLGEASANAEGRWIRPGGGDRIAPGPHRVRIDVLSAAGQVATRGSVQIARTDGKIQGLSIGEEARLWRIRRGSASNGPQELLVFRPGAVVPADPKAVLPGQMISPQSMPLHTNPLEPVKEEGAP